MVYIQYRELMGTQYLISPLRNSPLLSYRERSLDGQRIAALASLHIDLHQYRRVSLSGHG